MGTSGEKHHSLFLDPPWLWIAVFFLLLLLLLGILLPGSLRAQDIAQVKKGVVKITAQVESKSRVGSGVIVKLDNDHAYIVTASHVVEGDQHPNVMFFTEPHRPFKARVLGLEGGDPRGLAALLVEGRLPDGLAALTLDQTASVNGGEPVTLIGFPRVEGTLWTVTTGTISGRKGSALSFAGIADEGNSGGPVLVQGKVVGIVTEVGQKFNYAAPAVVARFALDGWGVRLSEDIGQRPADIVPEEPEPVATQPTARALLSGKYQGLGFSEMGGMIAFQATYQQSGETVNGSYSNNLGDSGPLQGRVQGNTFEGRAVSQVFQGVFCDFVSEVGGDGKTIQGFLTCNNGNSGYFALERQ
ncbi:MAG: serine protease [Nitrospiraceae bacterium]